MAVGFSRMTLLHEVGRSVSQSVSQSVILQEQWVFYWSSVLFLCQKMVGKF